MPGDGEMKIPRTIEAVQRGLDQGLHTAAQIYISLSGEAVANIAVGQTNVDQSMLWLSAGKPIAAVAIAQLWERGLLSLDDKVAKHIPEFGVNGKEPITIRHVVTHTGGFRAVLGDYEKQPWDELIASVCAARLEPGWIIGKTAGYHPLTSWYILGELVRRLSGQSFEQYCRERIFDPLAMSGTSFVRNGRVSPGSSAHGPARDLGLFHEELLHPKIISSQTTEAITARHRVGIYDKTFKHVIDWCLGFIAQSNQYGIETLPYSFGPHASPRTFGHGGSRSSIGYADPEHGLVVVAIFTRTKTEAEHHARMLEMNRAIYEDLELATT